MAKRWLMGIMVAAVLLRVLAALWMGDRVEVLPGIYDQVSYHTLAQRLLGGHGFTFAQEWWPMTAAGQPTAHWSYLYTGYLVLTYAVLGVHPLAARLLQAVLAGVLMPLLVYRLARRVFAGRGEGVAVLAAGWVAFYGYFVYYAAALMTETFYILGILWVLNVALELGQGKGGWRHWLELGLALAVTAVLRQVFLSFVPFLVGWLVGLRVAKNGWRTGLKTCLQGSALAAVVAGALILPITWHNYRTFGEFVLLNTNAGYAFFWANHPVHGWSFKPLYTADMPTYQEVIPTALRQLNEAALEKELLRLGLGFVWQEPLRYLVLCLTRIPVHFIFWPLSSSGWVSNVVRVLSFGLALPFMVAGIVRFVRHWRGQRILAVWAQPGTLLLLFVVVYVGVHLASWAGIRYRLPTDAVALIFAAEAGLSLVGWARRRWQR